ncbi:hypothetical protein CTAYLR_000025 [Chrysophaeum taylorii]|uniref:ATP-dependent RNA helicase n=1 Tax=Chrysophaeum taylorii TaxID=2483200 RepID=A0AAD7XQT7_9STRA|nr:hypothetical protein CTAYLR_000025 [Chrysophaeum taylorii]
MVNKRRRRRRRDKRPASEMESSSSSSEEEEKEEKKESSEGKSDEEKELAFWKNLLAKLKERARRRLEKAGLLNAYEELFEEDDEPPTEAELVAKVKELERRAAEIEDRGKAAEAVAAAFEAEGTPFPGTPEAVETASEAEQEQYIRELLDPRLLATLEREGIDRFFPIQRGVLPYALYDANAPQEQPKGVFRDLCVAAPTGSGKTLIYALAIHQALVRRTFRSLRAVVVVPSRELARQARVELERFRPEMPPELPRIRISESAGGTEDNIFIEPEHLKHQEVSIACPVCDERPHPDVLVCTPGRLVDHVERTPGFTLQHVRYLVIDEADRLLAQSYQDWARKTILACFDDSDVPERELKLETMFERIYAPVTRRSLEEPCPRIQARLQKLLFSATLGDDPRLISTFMLENPKYFYVRDDAVRGGDEAVNTTALPATLREFTILCDAPTKPLALIAALEEFRSCRLVLVFANSVDTALRVACLLRLWYDGGEGVFELSSAMKARQRDATIEACRRRDAHTVLVASDAAARGIDMSVDLVLNYDAPSSVQAYVHRVGRAARAGRQGDAVTLIKRGQDRAFSRLRAQIDDDLAPTRKRIPRATLAALAPKYKACLADLEDAVRAAQRGYRGRPTTSPKDDDDKGVVDDPMDVDDNTSSRVDDDEKKQNDEEDEDSEEEEEEHFRLFPLPEPEEYMHLPGVAEFLAKKPGEDTAWMYAD